MSSGAFVKQAFNVIDHSKLYLTGVREIDSHPQVVMHLAMLDGQRGLLAKFTLEVIDEIGDQGRINMQDLEIINMPENGTLLTIDSFVGNALVIGVNLEAPVF